MSSLVPEHICICTFKRPKTSKDSDCMCISFWLIIGVGDRIKLMIVVGTGFLPDDMEKLSRFPGKIVLFY